MCDLNRQTKLVPWHFRVDRFRPSIDPTGKAESILKPARAEKLRGVKRSNPVMAVDDHRLIPFPLHFVEPFWDLLQRDKRRPFDPA